MNTWLNRGASGGLAGALETEENQPTANSPSRLTHRNSDIPATAVPPRGSRSHAHQTLET
jgi:hypothetical protein